MSTGSPAFAGDDDGGCADLALTTPSADDIANGVPDASTASALGPQNQPASASASFTFHA